MTNKISFKTRLNIALDGCFSCVGMGAPQHEHRTSVLIAHQAHIKNLVEVANGIIANYQAQETEKKLSIGEAQRQAKEALCRINLDHGNYLFIYDISGNTLTTACDLNIHSEILKCKASNLHIKHTGNATNKIRKTDAEHNNYWLPLPGSSTSTLKFSYEVVVPCWQWILSIGFYIDDDDAVTTSKK